MPLDKLQRDILKFLASQRDPESYVAGSTPINRNTLRYSGDIDVFHDREERVAESALIDTQRLEQAGFQIRWLRRLPSIQSVQVTRGDESAKLEWVVDSDYRFFPAVPDEEFGYALHPVDLAINKAMAAAGRREVRDIMDLVTVHETVLPLGAVIWAAVEKSPGFTPEGLIAEIRRNSNYPGSEWRALVTVSPIDPADIVSRLRAALADAEAFVAKMPTVKAGLLFLEHDNVVQPDPDHLQRYQTHAGRRRGHWPSNPEVAASMLERYKADRQ